MIYIGTYIALLIGSIYELILNKRAIKTSFILLLILLFIAIFRVGTGTDYYSYLNLWENVDLFNPDKADSYQYVEIGFRLFISTLKLLTENDFIYFFVLAAVPLFFLYNAILYFKLYPITALIFYYTFFYFAYLLNGIGQAITISIMLYSIKFIVERNIQYVLFLCLCSTLIHFSGIVILFLYLIMNFNISSTQSYLSSIVVGLIFLKFHIINIILEFVFPGKFNVYYTFFDKQSSVFQTITKIMIFSLLFFFSTKIKDDLYFKAFRAYSLGVFFFLSLFNQNVLGTRFFMLFKPLEILMILLILSHCKNIFTRITIFLVFLIPYSIQFYININNPDFLYNLRF